MPGLRGGWTVDKREKRRKVVTEISGAPIFTKLLLNLTWWVTRKAADGNEHLQADSGGSDNIGVFDRSAPLPCPPAAHGNKSDGTRWRAMNTCISWLYSHGVGQLKSRLRRCRQQTNSGSIYSSTHAMNHRGEEGIGMWDGGGMFLLRRAKISGRPQIFRCASASMVGLDSAVAVETLEPELLDAARIQAAAGVVHLTTVRSDRQRRPACALRVWHNERLLRLKQ